MKNHLLSTLFLSLLITSLVYGQCPQEPSLFFSSQSELDQFKADYPNCTEFPGDIRINCFKDNIDDPTAIVSLEPLNNLEVITGRLTISGDTYGKLSTLEGLNQLRKVDELTVMDMIAMENFDALTALDTIGRLRVSGMFALKSIGILDAHIINELTIENNPELISIGDLQFNTSIVLKIASCPNLNMYNNLNNQTHYLGISLSGLQDISFVQNMESTFSLNLIGNDTIRDLSAFSSINEVRFMNISSLSDLNSLMVFSSFDLDELTITNCPITSLDGLVMSNDNRTLNLFDNPLLSDLSWMEQHTKFGGLVIVSCPEVTSIEPLKNIVSFGSGGLTLNSLPIPTLEGLNNLEYSESLVLTNLDLIEDLEPLSKLDSIDFILTIENDSMLSSLDGLDNLRFIKGALNLRLNSNLQNLDGLYGLLESPESLNISENNSLVSIKGLERAAPLYEQISIRFNPLLDNCSIYSICLAIAKETNITVWNNGINCSEFQDVYDACGFPQAFKVYYDTNQNGMKDADEIGVPFGSFTFDLKTELKLNQEGVANFFIGQQSTMVDYNVPINWKVTDGEISRIINGATASLDTMYIGIVPENFVDNARVSFVSTPLVCNKDYYIEVIVQNLGTTILDGTFELTGVGEYIFGVNPVEINGSTVTVELFDLIPGDTRVYRLHYKSPGVDILELGSQITMNLKSTMTNTFGDIAYEEEQTEELTFLCSYDPNDKQVSPAGIRDENYTLFEEDDFNYNIRFQNTGNYFAQDVTIRDTIDQNLDINTFQFVSASHNITQIILEDNAVAFVFKNIFLPDSISNEPESHGYVKYVISSKDGVEELTKIENTAHIIFDSNPAIVTNTVFNTMVAEYPTVKTFELYQPSFRLVPNPSDGRVSVVTDHEVKTPLWQMYNVQGALVKSGSWSANSELDLGVLPSGIYFFRIDDEIQKLIIK